MIDGVQQPTPYNPGASEQRKCSMRLGNAC